MDEARRAGNKQLAAELKGARLAHWINARNLTDRQNLKLATIQQTNKRLYQRLAARPTATPDLPHQHRGRIRAAREMA